MSKSKKQSLLSSKTRAKPIFPIRIQTAEGWKRSQLRKHKIPKTSG